MDTKLFQKVNDAKVIITDSRGVERYGYATWVDDYVYAVRHLLVERHKDIKFVLVCNKTILPYSEIEWACEADIIRFKVNVKSVLASTTVFQKKMTLLNFEEKKVSRKWLRCLSIPRTYGPNFDQFITNGPVDDGSCGSPLHDDVGNVFAIVISRINTKLTNTFYTGYETFSDKVWFKHCPGDFYSESTVETYSLNTKKEWKLIPLPE